MNFVSSGAMGILLEYFRACPLCGVSFQRVEWLCPCCQRDIVNRIGHYRRWVDDCIEHNYLLEWFSGDRRMSRLVYALKGRGFSKPYEIFSKMILARMSGRPEVLFYPSRGKKDHAFMLAHHLGVQMGISPGALIKQKTSVKQALLGRRQRQGLEIKTSDWKGPKALLVDDVVTSGATVRACYRALNQPKKLVVWSLFYRKDL